MKTKIQKLFLTAILLAGCAYGCDNPRALTLKSRDFYQKAVNSYQRLILRDKNNTAAKLELARLYFEHGEYSQAIVSLEGLNDFPAKKLRALCFFQAGDYTQALSIFENTGKVSDPEYLYYYGLTCQKQNLYEQAIDIFSQIKDEKYRLLAGERINAISGGVNGQLKAELKESLSRSTQENYPLAGAVILLADEKIQLFPENTLESVEHFAVKILNERGKKDFSEIEIGYDSTYEKVEVEYARTIKPSGEIVSVGEKDIRDVSRYLNFPLYSNARVRILSMPEIAEGAIVEYKVKITQNQLINKKDFNLSYGIQEAEPILYARFKLTIPRGRNLKIKVLNPEYNPGDLNLNADIKEDDVNKTYSWEFKDIPQVEPEPGMPPEAEVNPIILISSFESWDEIYKWWWPLARDRMVDDNDIKEKVSELIRGKNSLEEKIRAIYNYCVQEIRYVGIEYGRAGYQPHKAADIFKNKYGDCKDKAILFITMLKCASIEGYPVLIGTRGTPETQEDFPALIFNHCIAAVELGGKEIFLDITAEVCSFGDLPEDDQKRRVLVFSQNNYRLVETPLDTPGDNMIVYKTDLVLSLDETVRAKRQVDTLGQFDQAQRYWLRYTPSNLIEQGLKEKIQGMVVSGKLLNYNYENKDDLNLPIRLAYEYEGSNFLKSAGRARILPPLAAIDTSIVAKDARQYPLELGAPNITESGIAIRLPPDLTVKYLPENVDSKSPWLEYLVNYDLSGEILNLKQKQIVKVRGVPKSEYPEFKKFLEGLAVKLGQYVILEKKKGFAKEAKER